MKTQIFFIFSIALLFGCKPSTPLAEGDYIVNGKAEGVYDGLRAYLIKSTNGRTKIATDTAIVFNGAFTFKGNINGTEMRALTIDGVSGQIPLVLEAGEIQIHVFKDSLSKSKINGTYNNGIFNDYKKLTEQKKSDIKAIRIAISESQAAPELIKSLQKKEDSLRKNFKLYGFEFIAKHSNADFSLLMLNELTVRKNFDYELASKAFETINPAIKNKNKTNRNTSDQIEQLIKNSPDKNKLKIGTKAPDFSAPSPEGDQVKLSAIKGKVTIIDFWASWCKPCRIENPNLVKLYKEYHSKGLEIISVSLDRETQKEYWIKAIEKDQLNWYNVSNLKFWQDPIAKAYGVNSIPATFILDENGILIAERLRGAELDAKIKSLLD